MTIRARAPIVLKAKYLHTRSKNQYTLIGNCRLRDPDGVWVDGVVYTDADGSLYVRSADNFTASFEVVKE